VTDRGQGASQNKHGLGCGNFFEEGKKGKAGMGLTPEDLEETNVALGGLWEKEAPWDQKRSNDRFKSSGNRNTAKKKKTEFSGRRKTSQGEGPECAWGLECMREEKDPGIRSLHPKVARECIDLVRKAAKKTKRTRNSCTRWGESLSKPFIVDTKKGKRLQLKGW